MYKFIYQTSTNIYLSFIDLFNDLNESTDEVSHRE